MENSKHLRKIHTCSFINYAPSGIHRFAKINEFSKHRLALTRGDGSIEIWIHIKNINMWHHEYIIPGQLDYSIEAMVWSSTGGLIVAGSESHLTEWDIYTQKIIISLPSYGGAVLCMDFHIQDDGLLVGCVDGIISLFTTSPALEYKKTICRMDDKITSIAWHQEGKFFVFSTYLGIIHLFDYHSSTFISQFKTDSAHSIPWCLLFLLDFNVVLGDSNGNVQVWDIKCSSLLQSFKSHQADTLALCTNSSENVIISSSVDKTVSSIIKNKENNSWSFSNTLHTHKNDVTCLAYDAGKNELISGGVEGMCIHYHLDNHYNIKLLSNFGFYPQFDRIKLSSNSSRLIFSDNRSLHIWQLPCDTDQSVVKLIEFRSHSNENIDGFSISDNGDYFSYSTITQSHVYSLPLHENESDRKRLKVKPVKFENNENCLPFFASAFSTSSRFYSIITRENDLIIYDLKTLKNIKSFQIPLVTSSDYVNGQTKLFFSTNDKKLISYKSSSVQQFYHVNLTELELQLLPSIASIPVAATIVDSKKLVVASLSSKIIIFDLLSFDICHEIDLLFPREHANLTSYRVRFLGLYSDSKRNIILYSNYFLAKFPLKKISSHSDEREQSDELVAKKLKRSNKPLCLSINIDYKPIIFSSILNDGSLVLVKRKFKDILSSQLPSLYLKKFYKT